MRLCAFPTRPWRQIHIKRPKGEDFSYAIMSSYRLLEEENLLYCIIAANLSQRRLQQLKAADRKKRLRAKRRFWARSWLIRRPEYGQYEKLMAELVAEDQEGFRNFLRVDHDLFQEILAKVGPRIERQDTFMRKAMEPGLRLAITLRFLATGDSYKSIEYGFRVANNTISSLVPETCEAIIAEYGDEYVHCPTTEDEWLAVSDGFSKCWNFHHTLGALDGKHIAIRCPANEGSVYYNYKGFFSVVLLALVDAEYRFIYADVGSNGGYEYKF